jgi:hypothetical protein
LVIDVPRCALLSEASVAAGCLSVVGLCSLISESPLFKSLFAVSSTGSNIKRLVQLRILLSAEKSGQFSRKVLFVTVCYFLLLSTFVNSSFKFKKGSGYMAKKKGI